MFGVNVGALRLQSSCNTASILRPHWGRNHFQAHLHGCWLASGPYQPLASHFSSLPHLPLPQAAVNMEQPSLRWLREWKAKRCELEKSQYFCNLISEATFHHFFHILFVRNKSPGTAYSLREEISSGMFTWSLGSLGVLSEAACYKNFLIISRGFLYCTSKYRKLDPPAKKKKRKKNVMCRARQYCFRNSHQSMAGGTQI